MDTVYIYKYCIEYWDEGDNKMCIERGIAFGSTFSEVVHHLEAYYGEKNIESIRELMVLMLVENILCLNMPLKILDIS